MTAVLDALAPGHRGRYDDGRVAVCRRRHQGVLAHLFDGREPAARTPHFELHLSPGRIVVLHDLAPDDIDNDLAGIIAAELFGSGLLVDQHDFERVFIGVVRSSVGDPLLAWSLFYGNTLAALRAGGAHGSIAELAPIYDRVSELVLGTDVLEAASCFGFLSLRLADVPGRRLVATDISAGSMRLLSTVSRLRDVAMTCAAADAHHLPFADSSTDTALAVHLLEHLPPVSAAQVLTELIRVARRRVVVAVPYETEPTAAYGHVRTFCRADLAALGAGTGLPYRTEDYCGGWLIVDVN